MTKLLRDALDSPERIAAATQKASPAVMAGAAPSVRRLQISARDSRKALPMTLTLDSAMAAAAITGDSSRPNRG